MDFSSPLGSDPSVVGQNIGEQEITLNGTNTPEPVLASTANKEKVSRDLLDGIHQRFSAMAGSYVESSGSDKRDSGDDRDFQFLDFLKQNHSSSSGSGLSFSSKPPLSEFPQDSEESSLSMDIEALPDPGSLVHVDSNISLGSWFGDLLPQKHKDRPSSTNSSQRSDDKEITSRETSPEENQCSAEQSKMASRYFMSESQLDGMESYSASPFGTPSRTLGRSVRQPPPADVQSPESVVPKPESCRYPAEAQGASAGHTDAFTLEEEDENEVGAALNFSGFGFQGALDLQQEVFGTEEFADDAADILDKDEEIFEGEHRLMMNSGDEAEITGSGFITVAESQSEVMEPKMSIGTYMAARSDKMGNFGDGQVSIERPSFGMKIRTPSPRKPYPLQGTENTCIVVDKNPNYEGNTDSGRSSLEDQHDETITEEHEIPHSAQAKVQGSKFSEPDESDNNDAQDTTLEPSMMSLSEAIMNMSTSVSNDDLARAIIEMSKKKQMEKMRKIQKKRQSSREGKTDVKPAEESSSQLPEQTEGTKQTRRGSKIPKSVSSTSPPKHVRMSYPKRQSQSELRKFDTRGRHQSESTVGANILENTVPKISAQSNRQSRSKSEIQSGISAQSSSNKDNIPPLRSIENAPSSSKPTPKSSPDKKDCTVIPPKPESQVRRTENFPVAETMENRESESDKFKTIYVSAEFENMKNWNQIMQESFMQDAPEHDDIVEKSASSEQEEMQTFNNGRDSVCLPDETSSKYLLSSTRTDLSLTRGSLSRESIEQLHKKLRIRGVKNAYDQREDAASSSSPVEKNPDRKKVTPEKVVKIFPEKKLAKDTTWKTKDPDPRKSVGPLCHSSPPDMSTSSRYSGEFQQMLPSTSFNEMATIQEHQFNHRDLEEEEERNIQKLDVIKEEEAETSQDTTLSGQSANSGDSQLTTETTHPAPHSIPPHIPTPILHPPQHLYPPMQHMMYRAPGPLPNSYISDLHYRQHLDGPYHTLPADYHVRVPTTMYPHSFGGYPLSAAYSSQHVLHSTATPMGYSLEQPSMASSNEMGLNHTASTVYPQAGYHHTGIVHGPRSATIDGRLPSFPETCYHQPQYRSAEASISVPAELVFPGVRCVSLLSHAKLPLVNKTERWMQVELNIVSPAIDCCFSLEARPLVGPHDTKNVEITFSPKREGRFEALLEVISYPVTSEGTTMLQNARSVPVMVNLKAVAEKARVEFLGPENKQEINFGETLCDAAKYLPLRILNNGAADIPICVVLCTKSQDRKCFAISDSSSLEWNEQDRRSLSILRTVVHPGDGGTTLWVHCRIPPKYCEASEPPKNLSAQVYMELDNSQKQSLDTVVLDSIPVEIMACIAKLHAPKNMQPLNFSCPKDGSQTCNLPVKNCGNVSSRVTFSLLEHTDVFSATPQHAILAAGELIHVSIRFKPSRFTASRLNSTLIMKIEPNGTKYEVLINADCAETQSDQSCRLSFTETNPPGLGEMPSLLTNKSHICWGGVPVGHSSQQRVVLRTSSGARKPLPMRVMIKGEDAACFQILREDDKDREELCSKQEVVMRAGQDKIIRILFGPTRCKMALAKLEIKAPVDQVPSTKFTIPMSGYGGKSAVLIEGLESLSSDIGGASNMFSANAVMTGSDSHLQTKFTVRNNSSRHAFVKAILYRDRECKVLHQNGMASCSPFQFVLPKHTSRAVTIIVQPKSSANRSSYSNNGGDLATCVCLWHGDEIARHLFKNALGKIGPSAINKSLSETNQLRGVAFDGIFEGEGSHDPEEDLSLVKPQLGDVQAFYTAMKKSIIEVFGPNSSKSMLEMVEPGKKFSETFAVNKEAGQNFDRSHQHYKRTHQSDNDVVSWQLSPEQVILSAPRLSGTTEPSKIKIINRSPNALRFDVAWSGHYLTITPHNGRVDPESVLVMLVSANPSLASRRDVLPWMGTVQVSTQDGRGTKQLRVQIRDDIAPLDASVQPATPVPRVQLKAHLIDHFSLDSFSTPMTAAGLSRISTTTSNDTRLNKIILDSAMVDFGQTPVKSSARSHLEFTNVCPSSIRWLLTSFAPAYVKDIETAGDLYRSTYSAFVFSHTSGLLEPGAKVRIPVSFNPMSEGSYSQFWDLEHHEAADSAAVSLNKIRIQVIGQGVKSNRSAQPNANTGSSKAKEGHGIYVSDEEVVFPDVPVNQSTIMKIPVKNRSKDSHNVRFINVRPPFHITHQRHTIRPMSYACLPVTFKPTSRGEFEGTLVIQTEGTYCPSVKLLGRGV